MRAYCGASSATAGYCIIGLGAVNITADATDSCNKTQRRPHAVFHKLAVPG